MMDTLAQYNKLKKYPLGKWFFSYMFCRKLPYFFSIKPLVIELEEGRAVVQMKERRAVHNHIPSVHAIAQCNLCEAAMAMVTVVTIPDNLRFIPVGMTVSYKKRAKGILRAIAVAQREDYKVGDTDVKVDIFDEQEVNVMSAVITLNIKEKE